MNKVRKRFIEVDVDLVISNTRFFTFLTRSKRI